MNECICEQVYDLDAIITDPDCPQHGEDHVLDNKTPVFTYDSMAGKDMA